MQKNIIWLSNSTKTFIFIYNDLNMKGKEDNLYALGCFTKMKKNHIAYMVGAIDAVAEYLKKHENLNNNIF